MIRKLYNDIPRDRIAIGTRYGDLEVLEYAGYEMKAALDGKGKPFISKNHFWRCKCHNCGNIVDIAEHYLMIGYARSCGCVKYYQGPYEESEYYRKNYNITEDKLYYTFQAIKDKCNNRNNPAYPNYGGLGIEIDDEWMYPDGYFKFKNWSLANGYSEERHSELTLDRKDIMGNFGPYNCIWVSRKGVNWYRKSYDNPVSDHVVDWGGVKYNITELSHHFGKDRNQVFSRINSGRSVEEAVLAPTWSVGKKGAIERNQYIQEHGEFKQNPDAVNPLVCLKYPDLDMNDPKLDYFTQDEVAGMRQLTAVKVETEEEYQKAREAAKQALIEKLKNQ